MSSELQNLYQRTVLEHCRSPRNFHAMDEPDRVAEGFNPLCGDKVTVYLRTPGKEGVPPSPEDGTSSLPVVIAEISFEAAGCAICLASASMMTELLDGEAADQAKQQAEKVLEAFKPGADNGLGDLGEIVALGSVRDYPSRIRCVTLPWRTFTAALDDDPNTVSTE
ncbi:MAG: SUF system NifU family Fe-S cluster assembly protein [Gammaproteobacteria bacterium]|nr:SUF system NifU family Fe-S cluster assembly protein [Gammaproteobacteria bacterium]